jgi:hypothetical protein
LGTARKISEKWGYDFQVRSTVFDRPYITHNHGFRSIYNVLNALLSKDVYCVYVQFPMCKAPIPHRISSSNSFSPYFNGCIGALDSTHIPVRVPEARCAAFRNRKGEISQNVLAICTMDMRFMFVLSGWEGSASDAHVFEDAQRKGFTILEDCYYLANTGYANSDALLVPYKGVQYHLQEWGIAGEWCVYAIPLSCNLSNLSYLGPGTLESCSIFGIHSSRTLLSEYLEL